MGNKLTFKHCVVLVNPKSTSARRSRRFIQQLEKHFRRALHTVETDDADYENHELLVGKLASQLKAGSLLCIAGGDGTISSAVNLLMTNPKLNTLNPRVTVLPLWGGNANDLAYMINGPAGLADIDKILEKGQRVAIHPLEVRMQSVQEYVHLATNYVSFGASAYAAHKVNQMKGPKSLRLLREAGNVIQAALKAKTFSAEIKGRETSLYDLILINGSRIAKVYRAPNSLTDKSFLELTVNRKHPMILSYFLRILGKLTVNRKSIDYYELTLIDGTFCQIDGEVRAVAGGTKVTVKPADKPFYVLSTRLK